jgi:NAD(P)H-hydrate epimerase
MQKAGAAIAQAVQEDFKEIGGLPDDARLLVLAGKGNNGGDALLAATELLSGRPRVTATVILVFGEAPLRLLARRALEALRETAAARVKVSEEHSLINTQQTFSLCLDGVFGFQFRPPLDPATAGLIAGVNAHPHIKLRAAVDLPSGLGETNGTTVFRADFTYATGMVKTPVVDERNAPFVGRLRYLDLGFFAVERVGLPAEVLREGRVPNAFDRVLLASILQPLARLRPAQTDKRTYGHLFLVGGSRNYPGAVVMAAQAALRSGVGLLTAFVPESLVPEYAARLPEVMWMGWPETSSGGLEASGLSQLLDQLPKASAVAIGPGLGAGPETMAAVQEIVRAATCPILLDADALRPEVVAVAKGKRFICTPHAGEFKRIASGADLRDFCRTTGAVVVRKGSPTRVSDGRVVYHDFFGGPVLARGGSGDLLAGMTGGVLAQNPDDVLLSACRGVVWHGLAADLLARDRGQVAVQTTQLLDYLTPALRLADHETS